MNLKLITLISLCAFITLTPNTANAQWQGFARAALSDETGDKWYDMSRFELCLSYPVSQGFLETQYEMYSPQTGAITKSKKGLSALTMSKAYGAGVSMSFPLTAGRTTCLAISSAFMGNVFSFTPAKPVLVSQTQYLSQGLSYTCVYFPVSLDFKYGADAVYNRGIKSMFNIGIGAYPYVCESSSQSGAIGIKPFAKAELGFFAGIAMKLRVTCSLSSMTYDENTTSEKAKGYISKGNGSEAPNLEGTYTVQGSPDLVLSLVILPFSRKWVDDKP